MSTTKNDNAKSFSQKVIRQNKYVGKQKQTVHVFIQAVVTLLVVFRVGVSEATKWV